jgi:hypothetical protein
MSPLLYHVVHFTTGLHHTAVILHILFIATFNTNSVQFFNSSCIRAVFPPRHYVNSMSQNCSMQNIFFFTQAIALEHEKDILFRHEASVICVFAI